MAMFCAKIDRCTCVPGLRDECGYWKEAMPVSQHNDEISALRAQVAELTRERDEAREFTKNAEAENDAYSLRLIEAEDIASKWARRAEQAEALNLALKDALRRNAVRLRGKIDGVLYYRCEECGDTADDPHAVKHQASCVLYTEAKHD